jgi:hypothetical protein
MEKLSGKVIDDTTGQPVSGASIMIEASPAGHRDLSQFSNGQGVFSLALPEGAYKLQIWAEGFTPRVVSADNSAGSVDLTIRLKATA